MPDYKTVEGSGEGIKTLAGFEIHGSCRTFISLAWYGIEVC